MAYIRKRGAKWYYTIEIGTGKERRRKEVPGGATRAEAEAEAAYARALVSMEVHGGYIDTTKKTVGEFFPEWLADDVTVNTHANTARSYRSIYETHIRPALGSYALRTVRAGMLQKLLNDKKEAGLSRSTVSSIRAVLMKAFAYAADFAEYIPKNPAQNIHVPKYQEARQPVKAFDRGQLAALFDKFAAPHPFHLPLLLSYHTGARIGECCALTWNDVDFDAREVSISKTVVTAGGAHVQNVPKSAASRRRLPFGDKLAKTLRMEKARQAVARLQGKGPGDAYICHNRHGRMMSPDDLRYFNMYCREHFGEGYTFHSLRHTHATLLLEGGEDLELVSKRLGHSSMEITARTYSHILEQRKEKTRRLLDEIL